MKEEPLVSVIIPTYKRPGMLGKAIDSVLNQTYDNIEIIIVDDNDDNEYRIDTEEFMADYLSEYDNIRYIKHEKNKGACAARNTGIRKSKGKYITFLDDDDRYYRDKVKKQVKALNKSKCKVVFCAHKKFYISKTKDIISSIQKPFLPEFKKEKLFYKNILGPTSVIMIDSSVFEKINYFDEKLKSRQDLDLYIRLSQYFDFEFIEEPLVKMYIHDNERISNNTKGKIDAHEYFYNKYHKEINENNKIRSSYLKLLGDLYYQNNDYVNCRKNYIASWKYNKMNIKSLILYLTVLINPNFRNYITNVNKTINDKLK
ncbi:glycosyltransferase family 2 protein [Halanaerobiaceae bacterium Z-7014]|uniref:Glycosyltransferase family 2 protein n=1 Tax=Halonatronomonas betaini TaxID=2778430 RepID=A0A931F646_9FIRM|nr:glycosyltransferase family 2 protein [Halonatronomonas betaini]MBF8436525.1 glycosyltransferase family 2 protein [Halonatronomonas betaini]